MFRLLTTSTLCTFILACASQAPAPEAPVQENTETTAIEQAKAPDAPEKAIPADSVYPLLLAEFALRRREYDVALETYIEQSHILADPGVRSHATHLAQFMQQEDEALEAVQLWVQVEPDSVEANNTLATLLTRQGRSVEALPHLAMVGRSGAQAKYPILLTGFRQLDTAQQSELVAGVNSLSSEFPTDIQLLITQALIHEELGQSDLALEKIRRVFEQEPYQNQAVLLEAKLLVDRGAKKPFKRMEEALEVDPDDNRLRLQYARLLTRSDMDAARAQFELMSAKSPRDGDLLFSLALINRETGDQIAAKAYLRQLLDLEQRVDEAHYYLGRIAEEEDDLKRAVSHYMKVEDGGDFFSANNRIGRILLSANQAREFHAYIEQLRNNNPDKRAQLYALEVDLLIQFGEVEAGMAIINRSLEEYPNSTALRYTRSMLGEQLNDLGLMESDLRTIIDQDPENATALNALGYSLANRTERYDEAHTLISRALELEPDEPAILDSMGWVLFRQGSYEEALTYLSRAYVSFPDPEVAAHLGEVLWVSGDTEAAMDVWSNALQKAPKHKVLVDTIKRLGITTLGVSD
jgi:tetratricopeptide (TPR) repeat protein